MIIGGDPLAAQIHTLQIQNDVLKARVAALEAQITELTAREPAIMYPPIDKERLKREVFADMGLAP